MTSVPGPERSVTVIAASLPPGLAANAAAVLALTLGARHPELPGPDLRDADDGVHPGLIPRGLPVLSAPDDALPGLRAAALAAGLYVVDFPTAGQQTTDYQAFTDVVASTRASDLSYLGVAVSGTSKAVRQVTGRFPLLR